MRPRNPEEILKALEDQALEDEIRDIAAMSDGELDSALRAAGIDPKTAHAAAREIAERAAKPPSRVPHKRQGTFARPSRLGLIAGLAAAAIGMLAVVMVAKRPGYEGESQPPAQRVPRELRDEAFAACAIGAWRGCEEKLDRAKELDPAGETDLRVRAAREAIDVGLHPDAARSPEGKP